MAIAQNTIVLMAPSVLLRSPLVLTCYTPATDSLFKTGLTVPEQERHRYRYYSVTCCLAASEKQMGQSIEEESYTLVPLPKP